MTNQIVPQRRSRSEADSWIEERIGLGREWPDNGSDGPRFAAPDNDEVMLARGYVKVETFGGAFEWHRPYVSRRRPDPDAPDPRQRCGLCHRDECSH